VSRLLRVAAAQGESLPGEVDTNVASAVTLVREGARRGARVVVLPELFLTGYDPDSWVGGATVVPEDPRLAPLTQVAAQLDVVAVVGAAVRRSADAVTLSLLVFSAEGVRAPYDKQHLFADERAWFTAGDHGASIVVDDWELGLGVCYDGCFPEHAAAAAAAGADAYLCPSAYYVGSEHRRDLYYPARALDNGMYVVFSGLAGRCGSHAFNGGSAIYDPEGRVLDRAGAEVPAVVCADLLPEQIATTRREHPMGSERLGSLGSRVTLTLS
jgi:predicted amidohydrolase